MVTADQQSSHFLLFLLALCSFLLVPTNTAAIIEIGFSKFKDDRSLIYKYFDGVENGFYVDIGSPHPIYESNTAYLRSLGWKGVNVESNPETIKNFYGMNVEDMNLNMVVSGKGLGFI